MTDDRTITTVPVASILVAELEPISRLSLSELLRDEGYRVFEAADSAAAVQQLSEKQDIKIILADLEMPSWRSIVKHARVDLPESFVLGMVRYGALANALEAQQLGAHAHLVKPLAFDEVSLWIQRCLTGRSEIKR
jgi:two-component system NtrC family response regulator